MPWLASLALTLLHALYSLFLASSSLWNSFTRTSPLILAARRRRTPTHLAVVLVANNDQRQQIEETYIECVERTVDWCRTVGIERLTVYDREGVLIKCSREVRERVKSLELPVYSESSDSDVEYPLTPPLSDHAESRPLSPEYGAPDRDFGVVTINVADRPVKKPRSRRLTGVLKRRRSPNDVQNGVKLLTLQLVSRESSKPAIASLSRSLVRLESLKRSKRAWGVKPGPKFQLSINDLNSVLEGPYGFPSPDFMIVHPVFPLPYNRTPLELHGFPPWQIRLTEIYHNKMTDSRLNWWQFSYRSDTATAVLDEVAFRDALDQFADAEFRLGK